MWPVDGRQPVAISQVERIYNSISASVADMQGGIRKRLGLCVIYLKDGIALETRPEICLQRVVLRAAVMRKHRNRAGLYYVERLVERKCRGSAIRLRKGQPVSRSNGVSVIVARPVVRPAPHVAHFRPRIPPKLMLDRQVVLEEVRRAAAEILANGGIPKAAAKAVRRARGKLVRIVEKPSIAAD